MRNARIFIISSLSLAIYLLPLESADLVPPGVPEPGVVVWGNVVNKQNPSQGIPISSVEWLVGSSDGKTNKFSARSTPPTRITSKDGVSYYLLEVPFDTRTFGAVSLADPGNSFELKNSNPPMYTLTPTINGVPADVVSVNNAPTPGASYPVQSFNAAERGRLIRVDLSITPATESYDEWAARYFGSPNDPRAARTADPDGDGMSNEQEYLAGTDPTDANSTLRVLTFSFQSPASITWQIVSNRSYFLQSASEVTGPWTNIANPAPTNNAPIQANFALRRTFYRVASTNAATAAAQ